MKKVGSHGNKIELPAITVTVRVEGTERAELAFFQNDESGWDILCGVADISERQSLVVALRLAGDALENAAFGLGFPGSNDAGHNSEDDEPPF